MHLISSGRAEGYGWPALAGDARRCGVGFLVLLPMRYSLYILLSEGCDGGGGSDDDGGVVVCSQVIQYIAEGATIPFNA